MTSPSTCSSSTPATLARCGVGPGERSLVKTVLLDDLAAHPLHRPVHRLVPLQDPAHLAPVDLVRLGGHLDVLEVEAGGDAGVSVVVLDAEGEDPQAVDLALAEQELRPAERQQAAVQPRHHLVMSGRVRAAPTTSPSFSAM